MKAAFEALAEEKDDARPYLVVYIVKICWYISRYKKIFMATPAELLDNMVPGLFSAGARPRRPSRRR